MKEKLKVLIKGLGKGLIERDSTIKLSLLSLLAQENLLIIGPPGTAKSEISRRIAHILKTDNYFEYLLTKFTTPEEIFGPLSIKELKEDIFKRNTDGYLPSAEIGFLDEIFKANSSILNSLLTLINEKTYHNGKIKEKVPLKTIVGASNELPVDNPELVALYDRFLLRVVVDYISSDNISQLFDLDYLPFSMDEKVKLSVTELNDLLKNASEVSLPEYIKQTIEEIRRNYKETFKENVDESISDRRLIKILKLLKVSAYTNGRKEVDFSDLMLIQHCLWNNPLNISKVTELVVSIIKKNSRFSTVENHTNGKPILNIISPPKSLNSLTGSGTENDPYLIYNSIDLLYLNDEQYSSNGNYFKLMNDIDLTSLSEWTPIKYFKGHFDGNNKIISNINSKSIKRIGFFIEIVKDSIVSNLHLDNVNFEGDYVGGLAFSNNGTIESCSVKGKFINHDIGHRWNNDWSSIGVLVSENYGIINSCYTFVDCCEGYGTFGGIAFLNKGSISNCITEGNMEIFEAFGSSGGIVGSNENNIEKCCSNINIVRSSNGISGRNSKAIKDCVSLGKQSSRDGRITNGGEIKGCYCLDTAPKSVNFESNRDGKDGQSISLELLTEEFYRKIGWDFDNIWIWDEQKKTPQLRHSMKNNQSEDDQTTLKFDLKNLIIDNIWL